MTACLLIATLLAAEAPAAAATAPAPTPSRAAKARLATAGVLWAIAFAPMVGVGAESLRFGWAPGAALFLPVAGPFAISFTQLAQPKNVVLFAALLLDALVQAAAAGLALHEAFAGYW